MSVCVNKSKCVQDSMIQIRKLLKLWGRGDFAAHSSKIWVCSSMCVRRLSSDHDQVTLTHLQLGKLRNVLPLMVIVVMAN